MHGWVQQDAQLLQLAGSAGSPAQGLGLARSEAQRYSLGRRRHQGRRHAGTRLIWNLQNSESRAGSHRTANNGQAAYVVTKQAHASFMVAFTCVAWMASVGSLHSAAVSQFMFTRGAPATFNYTRCTITRLAHQRILRDCHMCHQKLPGM